MEDVLDLYEQPYDPKRPLVCYDEWRRALIGETRESTPAAPGRRKRIDYEYRRNGVVYLHMLFEPLMGKRHIRVTSQHTMKDFAHCMKWLVDEVYPTAEARRILKKLEFHYTPKHGSWLNMAEIELSVFGRTMKNYIVQETIFISEAQALANERNNSLAKVAWQFRSADARIKLKQLYPSISA